MTDNKLVKATGTSALEKRIDPQVLSKATPDVGDLLQARADLNSDKALQGLFDDALEHDDEWLVTNLTSGLLAKWEGHGGDGAAREAAQYLVDEYRQLGEGIHLVNTETGKVAITLTDADIIQPAPVPREGGGMATPLKQIRPDLAAFVTTWTFDRAHEQQVVDKLAARGHQTALLREEGDPRLLVATREGRKHIVASLAQFKPEDLLRALGGTSAVFLRHFELTDKELEGEVIAGKVLSQTTMGIQDQTTVNLHHNRPATMRGALTQGWVREVARRLVSEAVERRAVLTVQPPELTRELLSVASFWIAPPEAMVWVRRAYPQATVLPVDRLQHMVGLTKAQVGSLSVPPEFGLGSRELFGRWETKTELTFSMIVDWDAVSVLGLDGLEYQAVLV